MNTTLHHSTTHPPDTTDRQVLHLPAPDELRELSFTERLSLRLGLWLLEWARRPRKAPREHVTYSGSLFFGDRLAAEHENKALLVYHLQNPR